jgi:hypothetical protein
VSAQVNAASLSAPRRSPFESIAELMPQPFNGGVRIVRDTMSLDSVRL